ncbi:hypothetical protein NIES2119_05660 [[Phormidium ambiguum] IAM M-71]|uniref:eCIS core domain-containing protein n=1 Tax=[Phormidium ambiguum] IAM M-71 TaxID=454136 RepID=A0A1U7IQW4_9CYAN|nr:DUF4157 domain-containing protein [Phormidium ambiguum]OKH39735.1 hypothetical protein NIES2119_05660 [Phormidium ambiguum IAM M-71]
MRTRRQQIDRKTAFDGNLTATQLINQPRAFMVQAAVEETANLSPEQADLQTQLLQAQDSGYNFAQLQVQPTTSRIIQPKLTIGHLNGKYEQQADSVAQKIVGLEPVQRQEGEEEEPAQAKAEPVQRQEREEEEPAQAKAEPVQRQEREEEEPAQAKAEPVQRQEREEEEPAQAKAESKLKVKPVQAKIDLAPTGSGKPMPEAVQQKMETAFGADFSGIRIHEGPQAKAMNAIAYTQGENIHFQPGKYQPETQSGQELLGHELTHVVQQKAGRVTAPQRKAVPINADINLETEADLLGAKAARGEQVQIAGASVSQGLINRDLKNVAEPAKPKAATPEIEAKSSNGQELLAHELTHVVQPKATENQKNTTNSSSEIHAASANIIQKKEMLVKSKIISKTFKLYNDSGEIVGTINTGAKVEVDPEKDSKFIQRKKGKATWMLRINSADPSAKILLTQPGKFGTIMEQGIWINEKHLKDQKTDTNQNSINNKIERVKSIVKPYQALHEKYKKYKNEINGRVYERLINISEVINKILDLASYFDPSGIAKAINEIIGYIKKIIEFAAEVKALLTEQTRTELTPFLAAPDGKGLTTDVNYLIEELKAAWKGLDQKEEQNQDFDFVAVEDDFD